MAPLLAWIGLGIAYAWSVRSLARQRRFDPAGGAGIVIRTRSHRRQHARGKTPQAS